MGYVRKEGGHMLSLKGRTAVPPLGVASPKATSRPAVLPLGVLPTQRRRHPRPSFLHMGPAALCITCVLLVGLMAVLYLSQVGQVVTSNHQLQEIRNEQAALERQNQDLVDTLAQEQSPNYIAEQAKKMRLAPLYPKNLSILQVPHLH